MDLSPSVLGKHTATQLRVNGKSTILRIGRDHYTRKDLSRVECWNFTAAANLSKILNAELKVKDTKDVFENVSPLDLALPRLGTISIAVLGAAFEAKKLGGDTPLNAWVTKHLEKDHEVTTFSTIKHQRGVTRKRSAKKSRPNDYRYPTRAAIAVAVH